MLEYVLENLEIILTSINDDIFHDSAFFSDGGFTGGTWLDIQNPTQQQCNDTNPCTNYVTWGDGSPVDHGIHKQINIIRCHLSMDRICLDIFFHSFQAWFPSYIIMIDHRQPYIIITETKFKISYLSSPGELPVCAVVMFKKVRRQCLIG